jgi:hypothetical protein
VAPVPQGAPVAVARLRGEVRLPECDALRQDGVREQSPPADHGHQGPGDGGPNASNKFKKIFS